MFGEIEKNPQKEIEKVNKIMQDNTLKIAELKLINESLFKTKYEHVRSLHYSQVSVFTSDLIKKLWSEKVEENGKVVSKEDWFYTMFKHFYHIEIEKESMEFMVSGWNSYNYIIKFKHNNGYYLIEFPDVDSFDKFKENNGYYRLMTVENKSIWSEIKHSYLVNDIIETLKNDNTSK